MNWLDAGYSLKLYVSTDGDIVSMGTRTDYPFEANGSAAAPLGWTAYLANGGLLTHVNWTTQDGRFSISNVGQSNSHAGMWYGIYRDFPVTAGNRYIVQFQTRIMQNKTMAWRLFRWQQNGAGPQIGAHAPAQEDWEQMSYPILAPAGVTFYRFYLIANPYWEDVTKETTDWGIQFQNFAVIELQPSYPEPTFKEVTCDIHQLATKYGRSRYTGRYEVASASIGVVNNDGEWVYSANHPWGLRPGRFVKVELTEPGSATIYPMFYGLIDRIIDAFTLDGKSMAALECVDVSSLLSNWNVPTSSHIDEAFQSGTRIKRLADSAGWLTQKTNIQDGIFYQQAILANGRTIRDEMGLCADSEKGYFFCDRTGKLTYVDRNGNIRSWGYVQAELLANCVPPNETYDAYLNPQIGTVSTPDTPDMIQATTGRFRVTMKIRPDWDVGVTDYLMAGQWSPENEWFIGARNYGWIWGVYNTSGIRNDFAAMSVAEMQSVLVRGQDCYIGIEVNYASPFNVKGVTSKDGVAWDVIRTANIAAMTQRDNASALLVGMHTGSISPNAARIYWMTLERLDANGNPTVVWRFDANDYPGTGTSYTDPRGRVWSLANANAITPKMVTGGLPIVDTIPDESGKPNVFLQSLDTDWDRSRVINDAQIANQGGTSFQLTDDESKKKYGPRTYQRMDFVNGNTRPDYTQLRLHDYIDGWTEPILRVNRVSWHPNVFDAASARWAIKAFLNDLVRVRYEHPTELWGYSIATHIQSIAHTFSLKDWEVVAELDQPEAFAEWDMAEAGYGWDGAIWDTNLWDVKGP